VNFSLTGNFHSKYDHFYLEIIGYLTFDSKLANTSMQNMKIAYWNHLLRRKEIKKKDNCVIFRLLKYLL